MKNKFKILFLGMVSVIVGCFLFITTDSQVVGRIVMGFGVLVEIVAFCQIIVGHYQKEKEG